MKLTKIEINDATGDAGNVGVETARPGYHLAEVARSILTKGTDGAWYKEVDGEVLVKTDLEVAETLLRREKSARQRQYKEDCQSHILFYYPEYKQRSAALGLYPAEQVQTMADFIADCIEEEDRIYAEVEAAPSLQALAAVQPPTWPLPA